MSADPHTLTVIGMMALAAALCRLVGYGLMRFVPITPRIEAALGAIPLAVMIGIIVPPVLRGGVPELAGLAATLLAVWLRANDLVAIVAGMAVVAAVRLIL